MRAWLAFGLLMAACSSGLPAPTAADQAIAARRWPGASLGDLTHGRTLYVKKCAGCHALKSLDEVTPDQWEREISEMRDRRGVELADGEAQAMLRYLWSTGTRLTEGRTQAE
jgi:cytochrome c2